MAKMPKERGDELDKRLFHQISMGNDQIIFPALGKNERDWLHVRFRSRCCSLCAACELDEDSQGGQKRQVA
ncbi:hypothetical protein WJX75_009628 [Coccomyxa subellipsoidea]|uniref:Uncharacterized protein n=1 Tax=Coccomyxa subellipsoidea TaxID=248742 RepID=A0ABR2YXS4_9CHLO